EAVAMVVAETLRAAKDGAERVEVDYEVLPAVTETTAAAQQDAPRVHEGAHSNVCIDAEIGDAAATAAAFACAAHVARFATWVRRVTGVPMEPRAVLAAYDPESGRLPRRVRSVKRALLDQRRQRGRGAFKNRHGRHPRRTRRQGARAHAGR